MEFRWNDWNLDHIARHGVTPEETEQVILHPQKPYPEYREDEKWLIWGRGKSGRFLQVIYLLEEDATIYVIHARPLTEREKRRYRKRTGR
jgi:uncharacterized DUF497 family protein